jgi:aryl-alcohol dehydrogenase-like predicted oxidoreductase
MATSPALIAAVVEASHLRSVSPATVALSWLLSRAPTIRVIPGARTLEQLEASVGGVDLTLMAGEIAALDRIDASA